jgi:hypothetical protein
MNKWNHIVQNKLTKMTQKKKNKKGKYLIYVDLIKMTSILSNNQSSRCRQNESLQLFFIDYIKIANQPKNAAKRRRLNRNQSLRSSIFFKQKIENLRTNWIRSLWCSAPKSKKTINIKKELKKTNCNNNKCLWPKWWWTNRMSCL